MKIFLVSRGWPTPDNPQWGCFEKDQAMALKKMGHEVIIMNVDQRVRFSWRKFGITYKRNDGFDCYTFFLIPAIITQIISYSLWYRISQWQTLFLFKYLQNKYGTPDIVYAHYWGNIISCNLIREKYDIPLVGMEHLSIMAFPNIPKHYEKLTHKGYKKVDLLISVSKALQRNIYRVFKKESIVINNTIGNEFIDAEIKDEKTLSEFRFISIGNLLPIKGFDILIKAFHKSRLFDKGVKISIVGDGSSRKDLESLINELGLQNDVILHGRKTKKEIISLLNESNAFVLSSRSETFGVVFIEAMSQGLPVIGTKCGGPEDIVNETNGVLVPVDDIDELTNVMCQIYSNINKYDKNVIRKEVLKNYSPASIGDKLTKEFEKLINK